MKSCSLARRAPRPFASSFPVREPSRLCLLASVVLLLASTATAQSRLFNSGLRSEVSRLSTNDQQQDLRLYHLEQDVDTLKRRAGIRSASSPTISGKSTASSKSPVTPVTPQTYTVRPKDTLWRIAMAHRVSPGDIMTYNGLTSESVRVGQTLRIPPRGAATAVATSTKSSSTPASSTSRATSTTSTSGRTHTIGTGETFSQIAHRYQVSQAALQAANPGVNPNVIIVGNTLKIPASSKSAPTTTTAQTATPSSKPPATATAPASSASGTHIVRAGESLGSIAAAHGTTTAALLRANQLENPDKLVVGQKLQLSGAASSTSKAGSNASTPSVAESKASTTPAYPAATATPSSKAPPANTNTAPLNSASTASTRPTAVSPGPAPQNNHRGVLSYRVDSTDTLESIAATFGTTPDKIRELNRKPAGSKVTPNEEILVPATGAVSL